MMLLGLFIAVKGTTYRAGTLMHMGRAFCRRRSAYFWS